jgi:RHS repeat-associated protein
LDLVYPSGFHGNWQGNITCITKTSNTGAEPGFPPAGEREGGFYYLGNITHQVNTSNTVVAEYSFDAWGRRRNPTNWNYDLTGQPELFADRGFTGHEHLKWFNLINMNGRLYDPLVGRFLSPDNYVQAPGYTQSFNRYSYCLNNPLKYTDPSGMLQRPVDEYDAAFDAYFSWMTGEAAWYGNNGQSGWGASRGGGGIDDYFGNWANSFGITKKIFGGFDDTFSFRGLHFKNHKEWYVEDGFDALIALVENYPSVQGGLGASAFFGAVGVGGDVASMSNSTFRLAKNGSFSPGYYSSGWRTGNQYVKNLYSVSKVGTGVSTGAGAISTYMAYNDIIKGREQPITYFDAGVGTIGLAASYTSYFHGVEIPVVGEFVAIYGALRLSWDVGFYMGANYGPSKWYGTDNTKWFK